MTRINLLPPEKIKQKRGRLERNYLWVVIAAPLVVLLLVFAWWLSMGGEMGRKEEALKQANQELTDLQAKTNALKQYKDRQQEIATREATVVQALSGRIYWARILNNIGIMCPLNIWLTTVSGTSSGNTGQVNFEGRATQCPNRLLSGFYPGMLDYHPDFRPIAGWLERMAQIEQFERVWLASADPTFVGDTGGQVPSTYVSSPTGAWVIRFTSSATLNMKTAALGEAIAPASATPAPAPKTEEGTGGGGE